ncbi:hypothetical protein PUN28_008291 [Cardiocondyla obscurior]|uniref:Uncharacterized protein n=1 Tax=Cardiocondyla obscurior TaxID=286306 RepID=A0AAW2G244_9HYME
MPELSRTVLDPLACEQHLQELRADPGVERSLSPPDELHDGREGLCNVDMLIILRNLTHGKYKCFNLEILNNRMLMFDYGPKDSLNKPPRIHVVRNIISNIKTVGRKSDLETKSPLRICKIRNHY